ncbi:phage tail spike protein [Coprobacillaceae bacterium CR2/5/TPMF4]|nr:phage tail spike protein [Coprobacillaceae bacterium CR2/5/TPMF4]
MEALNGDDENSFINRWGGEIAYDNFKIIVNERQGADNGLRVEFGFNLNSINETINDEEVVTRIIPKAYNGYYLPDNETVDSPLINKYPVIHTRVIEYSNVKLADDVTESDEENSDVIICDTLEDLYEALRQKANEEYENGIDLPSVTYNVDMADLSRTELYKDYKDLLTVNLGDTVHVKHRKLGIETSARVISLSYDCITKKIVSLTLGDYEQNYFNDVSAVTSTVVNVINLENGTLMADKIAGVINLLNTSLRAQRNVADAANEKAILFEDLDEESETYGAMCMGTQGIQIAKERNAANTDWKWGTAINFRSNQC